jgi:hypothetical protein
MVRDPSSIQNPAASRLADEARRRQDDSARGAVFPP